LISLILVFSLPKLNLIKEFLLLFFEVVVFLSNFLVTCFSELLKLLLQGFYLLIF